FAAVRAQVAQDGVLALLGGLDQADLALAAVFQRTQVVQALGLDVVEHLGVRAHLDGRVALERQGRAQAPQDRRGARLDGAHVARAAAARAGVEDLLVDARAQALARELEQAELRDAADLEARAVLRQRLAEAALDLAHVARLDHVDEVRDDDPAQVAQADLARDLRRRLEVGLERDLLEIEAVRARAAGV